ncbi:MAG: YajQ family cyclic di-GMP-binding protein [Flavobacteriales bacterium]|nr:YajQ family cyclic di-GMP-binding protein [Flavobacteriales bacterium]
MPSFDIVSKVDLQTLDNAINSAKREIQNRYDFKGSNSQIDLDKKSYSLQILTEDDMRMDQIEKVIIGQFVKNKLDYKSLDFGKERYASGNLIRKDVKVKQGIDRDSAKKIVKSIKDGKFKVQASIMDDQVRVDSKKIDELQAVIAHCRQNDFEIPLQYINFK